MVFSALFLLDKLSSFGSFPFLLSQNVFFKTRLIHYERFSFFDVFEFFFLCCIASGAKLSFASVSEVVTSYKKMLQ